MRREFMNTKVLASNAGADLLYKLKALGFKL
jgi:hypothetical protein